MSCIFQLLDLWLPEREPQRRCDERRELGEEDTEPEKDDEIRPLGEALVDKGLPHHRDKTAGKGHEGVPAEGPLGAGVRIRQCPESDAGVDRSQDGRTDGVGIKILYFAQLLLGGDSM